MNIEGVYSTRKFNLAPFWHIVFEWEDIFIEKFDCSLLYKKRHRLRTMFIQMFYKYFPFLLKRPLKHIKNINTIKISFVMNAAELWKYSDQEIIPIIIDCAGDCIDYVAEMTKYLPFYWVTCYDFYKELKKRYPNNGAKYIPLSVSDIYLSDENYNKDIDVIQIGRKNIMLHEFMVRYCKEHPEVEYVYQEKIDTKLCYISTTRGQLDGDFMTRKDYISLLQRSKISLISSPHVDAIEKDGVDWITPRVFESAISKCHLIGRYSANEEASLIGLDKICPNIQTYAQFCIEIEKNLFSNYYEDEINFAKKHLTSERAKEILNCISVNA